VEPAEEGRNEGRERREGKEEEGNRREGGEGRKNVDGRREDGRRGENQSEHQHEIVAHVSVNNTCFWYPNKNVVFGTPKAIYFSI
jgi:hypothetical protein